MNNPMISIITSTKNSMHNIEQCLKNVLSQSYQNLEHIIVDGASTDGTAALLACYARDYPQRVKYISEPDCGPGDAWNKGIKLSGGDILGWLGADDTYEPEAISCVTEFFSSHPEAYFVYGDMNFVDQDNRLIKAFSVKKIDLNYLINDGRIVPTPSSFYRREVIESMGNFDEGGTDLEFFIHAAKKYPLYHIARPLANFCVHAGSQTSGLDGRERQRWAKKWFLISRRNGGSLFSYSARRYYLYSLGWWILPLWYRFYYFRIRMFCKKKMTGQ